MAYPAGMTSCVVTAGVPFDFAGEDCSIELVVTPVLGGNAKAITWAATGQPMVNYKLSATGDTGTPAQVTVPHVDQTGFVDGSGNAVTMFSFKAERTVVRTKPGQRTERIPLAVKNFQVVQGQSSFDLDLLPDGSITSQTSAPIPAVTSVNGQTGAVTVATSGGGGAIALDTDGVPYVTIGA